MIEFIARRDRVTIDAARSIFSQLGPGNLVRLELEMAPRQAAHTYDYDPLGMA